MNFRIRRRPFDYDGGCQHPVQESLFSLVRQGRYPLMGLLQCFLLFGSKLDQKVVLLSELM